MPSAYFLLAMLEINPGLILWTLIIFVALVLILKKVAWKPILEALHKREHDIHESLDNAAKAQKEAEKLLAENRAQLARFNEETTKMLNEAKHTAEQMKNQIVQQANESARQLTERAKAEIERDKDAAIQSLRKEVATLAIQAASKILDETLDENRHRKLVDTFLTELPKN
ncbi:MAG: F0F1 ATP synthase subunit B [Ignavibacteriales bacterium]|nr:F0F1 ATP synthase subunit B [Ignavibacteriales bacterium]